MSLLQRGLFFGGTEEVEAFAPYDALVQAAREDTHVTGTSADDGHALSETLPAEGDAQPTGPTKRSRIVGGGNLRQKKDANDLDSADECIIAMKTQGYSNEDVSKKLVQKGKAQLDPKSIMTRWTRLRKKVEQREEERLNDELSDWHVGEDDLLRESFNAVAEKVEREIQKLHDKKWKEVAADLELRLQKKKYTATACKDRLEGLQNGTALKPIEIDSDQEGRADMRATRIAEAKRRRAEAAAAIERGKDEEARRKATNFAKKEKKLNEAIEKTRRRQEDKDEAKRIQEERRVGLERKKVAIEKAKAKVKQELEKQRKIEELENFIYHHYTGKRLERRRSHAARDAHGDSADEDEEEPGTPEFTDDEEEELDITDDEDERISLPGDPSDADSDADDDDSETEGDLPAASKKSGTKKSTPKKATQFAKALITKETLLNPRSILTDSELDVLLFERGLPRRTTRETHAQVVARLAVVDRALDRTTVESLLAKHFDKRKGTKQMKIDRLAEADAKNSAAGAKGVRATDADFMKGYKGYEGKFRYLLDEVEEQ